MFARRALAVRWASRACQRYAPEVLGSLGQGEAARALQELAALTDAAAWRVALETARRYKAGLPLDADTRQKAVRAPEQTVGAARAWVCLHLVEVVSNAVVSYLFEEPGIDEDDAAVVRAWVADISRTLAFLAGGEAGAREEDERQALEETTVDGPEPGG